jgi:hypothetical protein
MATGAVIARILTQYSDKGSKAAQKDIARLTKKFDDFGRKARKSFGIAIAATATLAIKIGKDAVEAAIEDSKSQLVLANALISVTGSQKQLTEAAEEYIKTTMLRVNVADEVLRASLATLLIATGDLTEAERLQGIALDVAASQGKDLATVTVAITKAQQGNLTALKKLSPELSGLITKGMKAEEAFALLASTYGGSAEALADLDPLTKLKLAYGEVLETLGYELLPYVKEFVDVIVNDVLPVVDEWIKANGEDIGKAVSGFLRVGLQFLDLLIDIGAILEDNKTVIKWAFALLSIGRAVKFLGGVYKTFKRLREEIKNGVKKLTDMKTTFSEFAGKDSGVGKAVTMIGNFVSNIGKLILLAPGTGIAIAVIKNAIEALTGENNKLSTSTAKVTKNTYNQMRADQIAADAAKKKADAIAKARAAAEAQAKVDAAIAAQRRKEELADLREKNAIEAKVISIRKQLNLTKASALDKETDLINLAAAEALLKKQGVIAKEEIAKLERLKEENFLLDARETLAKRYLDIQEKLADQHLDTKEIEELSKKWGISNESVVAYIHLVKSVEDQVISADEIKALADMWNTSEAEAQKFLEVYKRIQDGLLDSNEVFDLIKQGFFQSEKEARIYADLVATVHDGIANDEDFEKLRIKWDLSKSQVNAYIAAMGAKFDYQGTFIDPVTLLKTQWDLAYKALERYLTLLNSGKGVDYNKFGPGTFTPGSGEDPAVIAAAKAAADAAAKAAADAAAALAESEEALNKIKEASSAASARDYAIAKALGDQEGMMIAAAGVNPSTLAAAESGAIGAASISAQLKAAEQALQNERIMSTYASFKSKEATDLLSSQQLGAERDYDERFRFNRGTVATAQGISGGNLMAAPVVNITVQGSVTAQEDLVQVVRNGLLATQYNGSSINLQAV